ncbi:MAG: hypothetical protein EHM56_01845, partial [Chloroflexi bacterium]
MKKQRQDVPKLIRPSTRAFIQEARQARGYSLSDWLHGYAYARWPYIYIGIGLGQHPLARSLGPAVRLLGRLLPKKDAS